MTHDELIERIRWIYERLAYLKDLKNTPMWGYNYSQEQYHLEREINTSGYKPF